MNQGQQWRAGLVATFGALVLGHGGVAAVEGGRNSGAHRTEQESLAAATEDLSRETVRKTGELAPESDSSSDGTYFDLYQFEGRAGEVVSIQLTSNDFDAFLWLSGPPGDGADSLNLHMDANTMGGSDSWLVVELPESGTYEITAGTSKAGETGTYEIRWQRVDPAMVEVYRLHEAGLKLVWEGTGTTLKEGIAQFEAAIAIAQDLQDDFVIGRTAFFLGYSRNQLSDYATALDDYQMALDRFRPAGEGEWTAMTLNNMGHVQTSLGNPRQALELYQQALPIYRQLGDRHGEAAALSNMGQSHDTLGATSKALTYYQQARRILLDIGVSGSAATVLNNLGGIYEKLGELDEARRYLQQALAEYRQAGNRFGEATALTNIGGLYAAEDAEPEDLENALDHYQQALAIFEDIGDRNRAGTVLNSLGLLYTKMGEQKRSLDVFKQAIDFFNRALTIQRQVGDRESEATTLVNMGTLFRHAQQWDKGITRLEKALGLIRQVGNRALEELTLSNLAVMYYRKGDLSAALTHSEQAIAIIEQLRGNIASADLRTSYFSTVQANYEFHIHLLMELHQKNPDAGYDRRAFNVSERTRARTLIELLAEANLDVGDTIDPALHKQEQILRQQLQAIDAERVSRLQAVTDRSEIATIVEDADRQSTQALRELDALASKLRQTNPAYAALQYPQPLTVEEVQTQVLDENTTLLQYSLGRYQSYLWVVTRDSITSHILSPREDIETVARQFYASVSRAGHPLHVARKAEVLSEVILGPAAEELNRDRLLIVPDGILHQVPFSALTVPNTETYTPLLTQYEIVNAPSSTVIATNRQIMGDRAPAPKRLVVIADPIFTAQDPRVAGASPNGDPNPAPLTTPDIDRTLRSFDLRNIARLPNTQTEAQQLLALATGDTTAVLNFDASHDWVMGNNASEYQYVHFATHGFANTTNPELSGLILSLVDENGRPQNGFLRLTDIFNLDLPAELVVLSACQTALGETVGGEGVVGLTRGLMYAGAERTVLSLWSVSDEKTADLMGRFYRNLWQDNQAPAAALRQAQQAMWDEGLHPYYWAAFGVQGEWNK